MQDVINKAWADGEIQLPLDSSFGLDYPIIQYGDDTLMIMPAKSDQLQNLKNILQRFSLSTRLKVNYSKSSIVPINLSTENCNILANAFGCKAKSLPFPYLGLPMGTTKPKMEHLIGIIERIDRRLSGVATTLSYDGRLIFVKSVVAAIPNYAMCSMKLPLGFINHVENSTRNFLWKGKDIEKKGKCLVKWEKVCLSKEPGGLGVKNLRIQNNALIMKNL